jgi:hypothetical protein
MDFAKRSSRILGRTVGGTTLRVIGLDACVSESPVRFSLPKLPRNMLDTGDERVTVVSSAQAPELFGYHPSDWPSSVPLH